MANDNGVCEVSDQHEAVELRENGDTEMNEVPDDSQCGSLTWVIRGFSQLGPEKVQSDKFKAGDFYWRVLLYPTGWKGAQGQHLSVFLEISQDDISLPYGWSVLAHFFFGLYNHNEQRLTIQRELRDRFSAGCTDWGLVSFVPLHVIFDHTKGFLLDDSLTLVARVQICVDYLGYDSKKETGFVGLKNQGATCYLNSLLQTLYHIPYFRKALYRMPTGNILPSTRIPLALQSLFYTIQNSNRSVSTKDLTESFGWSTDDSFMQQDVQELNRLLCQNLEEKMKGTVVEGTIKKLFEGHQIYYTECINKDYKSTHKESFYDLQLDVKGCKDVYASFDKYIEVEKLDGDNKYHAGQFGLQDAKRGVLFTDFPPVLQLHLKRFEYDCSRGSYMKINDRYEFPLQLDLDKDNGRYLSPDTDKSVRNLYSLYSVLVHSGGGVQVGHYYAFIRPSLSEQWFKFDDELVTKENLKTVLEEQYGGEGEIPQKNLGVNNTVKFARYSNAYMLVYVRDSDRDTIMCKIEDKDIAEHLKENDRKRREMEEPHLYRNIKVVYDGHLSRQIGKDIYFDLVDFDKVDSFRFQKNTTIFQIKEFFVDKLGIPTNCQKFWVWSRRQNNTWRPNKPITSYDESLTIEDLKHEGVGNELRFYLEEQKCPEEQKVPSSLVTNEDILLFFKLYDPKKDELRYIGRQIVKQASRPLDDLDNIKKMAGFRSDEEVELYEEISYIPKIQCERINMMATYKENKLQDGDIICLQRSVKVDGMDDLPHRSVKMYFNHMKNRQVVHFRKLEKPEKDVFCLELNKFDTYDELVENLARHLKLDDPSKIRLTPHNAYTGGPGEHPIKYRGVKSLLEMLLYHNHESDILYYEILDMPLLKLEEQKVIKVSFYNSKVEEVFTYTMRLHCEYTVGDALRDLRGKVEMFDQQAELRILQISDHKIRKILSPSEKIKYMASQHTTFRSQHVTYRAEEIPKEERIKGPEDCIIHVYHFRRDSSQNNNIENFGDPFLILIRSGETLGQLKERIKKKLDVPEDQFSEFKFAFVSLSRIVYLEDDEVVANYFEIKSIYGPWEHYLGLEHNDCSLEQPPQSNQVYYRPIKIYN